MTWVTDTSKPARVALLVNLEAVLELAIPIAWRPESPLAAYFTALAPRPSQLCVRAHARPSISGNPAQAIILECD